MRRRDFLKAALTGAASTLATAAWGQTTSPRNRSLRRQPRAGQVILGGERTDLIGERSFGLAHRLPRWRGFNLMEKMHVQNNRPFLQEDFRWISEWGFDFVRLPMDYRCWTDSRDPYKVDEKVLAEIDRAIELGNKHGIHVSLCLHRAPGYTVSKPPEKLDLWTSEEAQTQFDFHWSMFARRYKSVPSMRLSFNLVNEPGRVPVAKYAKVVRRVTAAIRKEDPNRLIIADGLQWGREPVFALVDLGIGQATRGYTPMPISPHQAPWVSHSERYPPPAWPLKDGKRTIDAQTLRDEQIKPWKQLEAKGVGVIVGEWGAFHKTPHDVVLRWGRDCLELWKEAGWGWALWNFRGDFGILDSGRTDVAYEDFHGHKLDRRLLDLLQAH